jgi:hypothetical protein
VSRDELLRTLKARFEKNPQRHPNLAWAEVEARLQGATRTLDVLGRMEETGGEPDVVGTETGAVVFFDCSAETPAGRRSLCYDQAAWDARKEHKPAGSALGLAASMGAELLTEDQYRFLQTLGEFDRKTSSWVATPEAIRRLGGALFCDRRYDHVFTYHNGADSYYGVRGFRTRVVVG